MTPRIRLTAVDLDGNLDDRTLPLSPFAREVCGGYVDLYGSVGFQRPWVGYLVHDGDRCVGTCGFKGPVRESRVEIAYFTFPPYEGRGYATAMAHALIGLASASPERPRVVAQTLPEPSASTTILRRLGFEWTGTVHHPDDGPVWEWVLSGGHDVATPHLRTTQDADLDAFFAHHRDPEARRMAAFTRADADDRGAFDAHWQRIRSLDDVDVRTIEVEGAVAGHVARFVRDGDREITYWIGREHWGRGIATRALALFLAEFHERPLYARAAADNVASLRVLRRNGFVECGRERSHAEARGTEIEEIVLVLHDSADRG